jgi:hypothetical protein
MAAGESWSRTVGVPLDRFRRPTIKTHKPSTRRRNVGDTCRGCLTVYVPKSSSL